MKTLLNILAGIVICVLLLLVTLRFTGLNPHGDTPGLEAIPGAMAQRKSRNDSGCRLVVHG